MKALIILPWNFLSVHVTCLALFREIQKLSHGSLTVHVTKNGVWHFSYFHFEIAFYAGKDFFQKVFISWNILTFQAHQLATTSRSCESCSLSSTRSGKAAPWWRRAGWSTTPARTHWWAARGVSLRGCPLLPERPGRRGVSKLAGALSLQALPGSGATLQQSLGIRGSWASN